MKKYLLCLGMCMTILTGIVGCGRQEVQLETDEDIQFQDEETLGEATDLYENEEDEAREELGEVVTSEDELYQVLVPAGWILCENKIDESMMFELQGETEEQYIGILVLQDEVYGDFDISAFMDTYSANAAEQYEGAVIGDTVPKDIGGKSAYTLKITGNIDEMAYINHVYVMEYDEEKVIFTASTYGENEQTVIEALDAVAASFQRVPQETGADE